MRHLGSEAPEKTYPTFVQAGRRKELEMIGEAQNNDSKVLDVGESSTRKQHPRCQRNSKHSAHDNSNPRTDHTVAFKHQHLITQSR